MDDWDLYDDNSWFSGSDTDFTDGSSNTDYNMSDWYNDNQNTSDWAYDLGNSAGSDGSYYDDYTYGGPSANGGSSAGGFNWGGLMNAGLMAGAGFLKDAASTKNAKDLIKFQNEEKEKYYQLHGKQLSDAYQKYKGYYKDPSDPANAMSNPTNIFGLLTPKPTTGPLANGY